MLKDHSLSHSLNKVWENYSQQVHSSRNKSSSRNIHLLRVSTQRLEALLTLANSVKSTKGSKNIIYLIKKVRKSLGPLRDIQVESKALKILKEKRTKFAEHEEFSNFFVKQKRKSKKKAHKCLNEISLKQEKSHVEKLVKKLFVVEEDKGKKEIQLQLKTKIKKSALKLNSAMHKVNPKRVKDIHRFRVQAKKLRYQAECLNSLAGDTNVELKNLKNVQSVAGRIQNDSVLLATIDKFLAKKKHNKDLQLLTIRKQVAGNQAKLINTDFKKIDTLKWQN
ncbi:MAG: CHAD domain-containing protein [Pseudobdellovibrio sp.]